MMKAEIVIRYIFFFILTSLIWNFFLNILNHFIKIFLH